MFKVQEKVEQVCVSLIVFRGKRNHARLESAASLKKIKLELAKKISDLIMQLIIKYARLTLKHILLIVFLR